jgi:hypothetical protein
MATSTVYSKTYLPGSRYIKTPHGSTQVFEFGPEDGQKVLLVHGISTPCIAVSGIAKDLVKRNCRVIIFGTTANDHLNQVLTNMHRSIRKRFLRGSN